MFFREGKSDNPANSQNTEKSDSKDFVDLKYFRILKNCSQKSASCSYINIHTYDDF